MSGPNLSADVFAGVMMLVAVYSIGRLVAARAWSRPTHADVDVAHVLMGFAMAGMLVSAINPIPSRVWEVVFVALAVWFVWRCYHFVTQHGVEGRDEDHVHHLSHYLTHVVMSAAMLYMYLAATAPAVSTSGSGGGMAMGGVTGSTANFVGLPLVFLFVLLISGVWELDGIGRFSPGRVAQAQSELAFASAEGDTSTSLVVEGVTEPIAGQLMIEEKVEPATAPWLAPRLEAGCHIAMCVTMGYMLILML